MINRVKPQSRQQQLQILLEKITQVSAEATKFEYTSLPTTSIEKIPGIDLPLRIVPAYLNSMDDAAELVLNSNHQYLIDLNYLITLYNRIAVTNTEDAVDVSNTHIMNDYIIFDITSAKKPRLGLSEFLIAHHFAPALIADLQSLDEKVNGLGTDDPRKEPAKEVLNQVRNNLHSWTFSTNDVNKIHQVITQTNTLISIPAEKLHTEESKVILDNYATLTKSTLTDGRNKKLGGAALALLTVCLVAAAVASIVALSIIPLLPVAIFVTCVVLASIGSAAALALPAFSYRLFTGGSRRSELGNAMAALNSNDVMDAKVRL